MKLTHKGEGTRSGAQRDSSGEREKKKAFSEEVTFEEVILESNTVLENIPPKARVGASNSRERSASEGLDIPEGRKQLKYLLTMWPFPESGALQSDRRWAAYHQIRILLIADICKDIFSLSFLLYIFRFF